MVKRIAGILLIILIISYVEAQSGDNTSAQLALQYYNEQQYDKAAQMYADLYARNANHYYYTYYLQSLLQIQDYKSAERLVHRQLKLKYTMWEYQVDLGYVYELQNESSKAKRQYESCISAIVANSSDVVDLAVAFVGRGKYDYALKTYLQGRKLSGNEAVYAMDIAAIYEKEGQYEKAAAEYFNMLNTQPDKLEQVEAALLGWWVNDDDNVRKELLRTHMLKYSARYPDNRVYSELLIWYAMQQNDFSMAIKHVKAMDKKYNLAGYMVMQVSHTAVQHRDYTAADEGYKYVLSLGNRTVLGAQAQAELLNMQYERIQSEKEVNRQRALELDKSTEAYFREHGISDKTIALYRKWVMMKAIKLGQMSAADSMYSAQIYGSRLLPVQAAQVKTDMARLKVLQNDTWEAILLNSQVEKDFPNDTIGQEAKLANAKISLMQGEFEWAKAQLDVLRAATTKPVANDAMYLSLLIRDNENEDDSVNVPLQQFGRAMYLLECGLPSEAECLLDSIKLSGSMALHDDVLYYEAVAARQKGEYSRADSLLAEYVLNYPSELLADDALYERAQIQELYLNDNINAMELYRQLLSYYSGSIYAEQARVRIRVLRGDFLRNAE